MSGCLAAALAAGALAASPALASFGAPFDLSDPGEDAYDPQVAGNADGDAVFVWQREGSDDLIQARARSAAGALGPVETLSDAGQDAYDPQVAVDSDGDAVFTWRRSDGSDDLIQARARSAAGALGPVETLSDAGQDAYDPQVAVDSDGDAVFTWRRSDGSNNRIQARARSAAGALGPVETLSDAGQHAKDPQVAVDPDGDAVFTWRRYDGSNFRIQGRARSAAGALAPVETLSRRGGYATLPQVAVDPDGDAVFTWRRDDGTNFRIQARARSAAGALGPVETLSHTGYDGGSPEVAVDAGGDAVFAWYRSDGSNYRIQARARSAAGALGPVETLSDAGQHAYYPQVAVDAGGDALVTWWRFDGIAERVQAAGGP